MSFEPGLPPGADKARAAKAGAAQAGSGRAEELGSRLVDHAELVRQQLGCRAVLIRIAAHFSDLFAPEGGEAPHTAKRSGDLCALAVDPASPRLPGPLRRAPGLLADPLAAGDMGFAFYAGLPLCLPSGEMLGMLVALDPSPRDLGEDELATLHMLAKMIVEFATLRLGDGAADSHPAEDRA